MEIWIDPLLACRKPRRRRAPNERAGRFWRNVAKRRPNECWPWKGSIGTNGYGVFSIRGKQIRASRRAYELAHGPIPDGLFVLHSCDNRPCCNPAHLRVGTHADNMRDMASRGRKRGGGIPRKLTSADARKIRLRAAGGSSSYALAAEYDIHPSRIQRIVSGKAYREASPSAALAGSDADEAQASTLRERRAHSAQRQAPINQGNA